MTKSLLATVLVSFGTPALGQYVQEWYVPHLKPGAWLPSKVVKMEAVGDHIYVLGMVQGASVVEEDYLLWKLDRTGVSVWQRTYSGPGQYWDRPSDMAFDAHGSVYVTGLSYQSKVGEDAHDYWTMKYDAAGNLAWTATHTSAPGHGDEPCGVEVWNGLVFVSGKSVHVAGTSTAEDYHTEVYNAETGSRVWKHSWNGTGEDRRNYANDITLDGGGNVVVAGRSSHPTYDYSIVRYKWDTIQVSADSVRATLVFDWERYFDASGMSDEAYDVACNGDGDIFVTGQGEFEGSLRDITTVKFDKSGNLEWSRTMGGVGNGRDEPVGLELDSKGNVVVFGALKDAKGDSKFCTIKYNTNGDTLWTTAWWSMAGTANNPRGFALDKADNIYMAGQQTSWAYVRKLNDNGELKWESRLLDAQGKEVFGEAQAIAIDDAGNIYVAAIDVLQLNALAVVKFKKM